MGLHLEIEEAFELDFVGPLLLALRRDGRGFTVPGSSPIALAQRTALVDSRSPRLGNDHDLQQIV